MLLRRELVLSWIRANTNMDEHCSESEEEEGYFILRRSAWPEFPPKPRLVTFKRGFKGFNNNQESKKLVVIWTLDGEVLFIKKYFDVHKVVTPVSVPPGIPLKDGLMRGMRRFPNRTIGRTVLYARAWRARAFRAIALSELTRFFLSSLEGIQTEE
jgi:hypothetical protein